MAAESINCGYLEGKCPADLTIEQAELLLNRDLHESPPGWSHDHPKWIFNIFEGAVYKAVVTNPGVSYHGFPCRGPRSGAGAMTQRMKAKLLDRAKTTGCLEAIEAWFGRYP